MLYASATFVFLMLPLSLVVFYLAPQRYRRSVLLAVSAAFYILANIKQPISIAILVVFALLAHLAGKVAARVKFRFVGETAVAAALVLIVVLRVLHTHIEGFCFPLGGAVWLLSCGSYVADIARHDAEPPRIDGTFLYIMFFPIMIAGPVVKYKDFEKYISESGYSINDFAEGAKSFAIGFIERIALATVMMEAYELILQTSNNAPNLLFDLLAMLNIFFAVYFAFAGWSDMGIGIARMFGISLPRDFGGALLAYSPTVYFKRAFIGLGSWLEDYVIGPFVKAVGLSGRVAGSSVAAALGILFTAVWIHCSLSMFVMAIAVAVVVFVLSITGADDMLTTSKLLKPIGFFTTFILISWLWVAGISPSLAEFFEFMNSVSVISSDYHIYYVYIVMSGGKYVITLAFALLFSMLTCYGKKLSLKLPAGARSAADAVSVILLLAIFAFVVVYYMPVYSTYATQAFKYFIF